MKKTNNQLKSNTFFDINKLPKEEGLLIFPISMSRATTGQSPKELVDYIFHFSPSKIFVPEVGLNFIYGDYLYFWSSEKASTLKKKFTEMVWNHKNGLQKLIYKHKQDFQIQHAFNYMVWNELYLNSKDFITNFKITQKLYKQDKQFRKYINDDAKLAKKKLDDNNLNFFLEEHLMLYLIMKKKIKLANDYIQNKEKWILICYPGKAPKGLIYLVQKNPLKLAKVQEYEGQYDLETKKFVDFERVDLKNY